MQHLHRYMVVLALCFLSCLALLGCAEDADNDGSTPLAEPLIDQALLRRWTLQAIDTTGGRRTEAEYGPYYATFTADKLSAVEADFLGGEFRLHLLACDGCNSLSGGYTVEADGSLSLRIAGTTLIECRPPPALEQRFPALLQRAASYKITGDTLQIVVPLNDTGSSRTLIFNAQPADEDSVPAACQ